MCLKLQILLLLLGVSVVNVFAQTVDRKILDKILQRAKETHSSSDLIVKDGKAIGEYHAGEKNEKIQLMSCTKSIVSLAIGKLIEQGKIKSVDQPVYDFYPEYKRDKKAFVTIKHLLSHTSGMQNSANAGVEVEASKDVVKLALDAVIADNPGTRFSYNNKAVNLLAGIIQIASGKRMDVYFRDEFFKPMQIEDFDWSLDAAGNPYVYAGLHLSAVNFIKFGQLVLNRGKWNGKQIVSEKWIDESLAQSQPFNEAGGLLWWRMSSKETYAVTDEQLQMLEKAGVEKSFLEKLQPLKGKVYIAGEQFTAIETIFGKDWRTIVSAQKLGDKNVQVFKRIFGEMDAYNANGYLGQALVIVPKSNLVAVRQIKNSRQYNYETDGFNDFMSLVMQLAR